jgi:ElaB/YqjD/DUF883 family membrane-anchored ribosome-binding protein
MDNSTTSGFAKNAQTVADKAADKVTKVVDRAQSMGRQGMDTISDVASQARDVASNTSDSIVAYTKNNPVKALAIAVASGALLYAAIKTLTPPRD